MKNKEILQEEFLKFADAFIHLSKTKHRFSLFILYKYFRSKKSKEKFETLKYILENQNTNIYLKEGIKAVLLTKWISFIKKKPGLIWRCKNSDGDLVHKGVIFSGDVNRNKALRAEADLWYEENKPGLF